MFEIRPAKESEIVLLAEIESQADNLFPTGLIPAESEPYPFESHQRALEVGGLLVACVGDKPVGFASAEPQSEAWHLFLLAVLPEWGRKGIGRALLDRVIANASANAASSLSLTTFAHIPWNGPFYQSAGFSLLEYRQCPQYLKDLLNNEAAAGFNHRVAMVYYLNNSSFTGQNSK